MKEEDIKQVAEFLHRAVQISLALQKQAGSKLLKVCNDSFLFFSPVLIDSSGFRARRYRRPGKG
jgi:hypothetical protein